MPFKTSLPQDILLYKPVGGSLNLGKITSGKAQDVFQVNILVYLVGNFTNKKFTLTLTEGERVYTSSNSTIEAIGRNVGYISFSFSKFHSKVADVYGGILSIDDPTGVEFWGIGDSTPTTNLDQSQKYQSTRVEFYGV